ncbi:MAG: hypothetical protein RIA69_09585 [Cyclobacteriaceae bacterium]
MNWKNRKFYLILGLALFFTACDTFEDDALPTGDKTLQLQSTITTTPNTDFYLDLKTTINTTETVRFTLNDLPTKGDANINEAAILHYKPRTDFVVGTDWLTVDLFNLDGQLLDTDSIVISMADSLGIPCFNGALADFYTMFVDGHLVFDPTLNDGLCKAQIKKIDVLFAEPKNGEISILQDSVLTYVYIPNPGFVGADSFEYELSIVDVNDNLYESFSSVVVKVLDQSFGSSCDSILYPFFYDISSELEFIEVLPFRTPPACDVFDFDVNIIQVSSGKVELTENKLIRYFPGENNVGVVEYTLTALNLVNERNTITFKVIDVGDTTGCALAIDDNYFFDLTASDSTATEPFMFAPFENDEYCTENFTIEIIDAPDLGTAVVVNGQYIQMEVLEEFKGTQTTSMSYRLCDNNICDFAYCVISIEK